MSDHDTDAELRALLSEAHDTNEPHFAAGFPDRVLVRIGTARAEARQSITAAVNRQAVRVLPALLAASLALIAWNVTSAGDSADSPIAAALGLQPVTIAAAVGSGAILGAESLQ